MKNTLIIFCLFIFSSFAFADNNNKNEEGNKTKLVYGKVIDKKSGEEIAGAEIRIQDKIVYTDLNGNFSASINTVKTEAIVTFVSYNNTKVNVDPFSYSEIIVELEAK